MKPKLILCLVLVLGGVLFRCSTAGHHAEPVGVSEIRITFAKQQVVPPSGDLPRDAMYPPDMDHDEHGTLSDVVAGRIAALTVTWADPEIFKSQSQVQTFLREMLSSTNGHAVRFHVWSQSDGIPSVVAIVEHTNGRQGLWWVWNTPSVAWAYHDGDGKWWWGYWEYYLPKPKIPGTGGKP